MLNKLIYVGFIVLELSKYLMYDFHYNLIKKKSDTDLMFTDTDSPTYEIKQKMFMKMFLNINTYLTSVNINQTFL